MISEMKCAVLECDLIMLATIWSSLNNNNNSWEYKAYIYIYGVQLNADLSSVKHFQNVQYLNKESSIYYPVVYGCSIITDVFSKSSGVFTITFWHQRPRLSVHANMMSTSTDGWGTLTCFGRLYILCMLHRTCQNKYIYTVYKWLLSKV